jgi:hypothetical protein
MKGVQNMTKLLTIVLVLAVALMAGVAQAAITAQQAETAAETAIGGVAATYLELTKAGVGYTREGLTLATDGDTWAYPDASDGDVSVNGNILDEDPWNGGSGTGAADFKATITGLIPSTQYGVYVLAFGRGNGTEDFAWGTEADGSPINVVSDISTVVANGGGVPIAGPTGGDAVYNNAVSIGNLTSDGTGKIVIWLGKAGTFVDPDYRTQFDGIMVTPAVLFAHDPAPVSPSTHVSIGTDLSWTVPTDANTAATNGWVYNVYFGTNSALPGGPITTVGPNAAGSRLTVLNAAIGGHLTLDTDYYWRVDSIDPNLSAPDRTRDGGLWTFKAGCTLPVLVAPADTYDPVMPDIQFNLEWSSDPLVTITHNVVMTPEGGPTTTLVNKTSPFDPYLDAGITMEWGKKYTWHVEEVYSGGPTVGPDWHFQVRSLVCGGSVSTDTNADCIINLADFANLASEWLNCESNSGGKEDPCTP